MLFVRWGRVLMYDWATSGFVLSSDEALTGWDDGVAFRGNEVSRPNGHGDFDHRFYRAARYPTVKGHALASSNAELQAMNRLLLGQGAEGDELLRLVVQRDGETLWAPGRPFGSPRWREIDDTTAEFQIPIKCPKPQRFGEQRDFSSLAVNYGNAIAHPVLTVTGTMPSGYSVTAGGATFTVSQALAAGVTHRIDMRNGRLYRNGSLQPGGVSRRQILGVPPGASRSFALNPVSGSGSLSGSIHDTYL